MNGKPSIYENTNIISDRGIKNFTQNRIDKNNTRAKLTDMGTNDSSINNNL